MIDEGYVAAEGKRKKVFVVTDVELIGEKLEGRLKTFQKVLPELYASFGEAASLRPISTYTDPRVIRNFFKRQMRREKRGSEFFAVESTKFHFVDFMNGGKSGCDFDIYERVRLNRDIFLKVLFVDESGKLKRPDFETKYSRSKREVRVLGSSFSNTLGGLYVWSDRVFLLTYRGDEVVTLVELANKDVRQGFAAYFESLWGSGEEVK